MRPLRRKIIFGSFFFNLRVQQTNKVTTARFACATLGLWNKHGIPWTQISECAHEHFRAHTFDSIRCALFFRRGDLKNTSKFAWSIEFWCASWFLRWAVCDDRVCELELPPRWCDAKADDVGFDKLSFELKNKVHESLKIRKQRKTYAKYKSKTKLSSVESFSGTQNNRREISRFRKPGSTLHDASTASYCMSTSKPISYMRVTDY